VLLAEEPIEVAETTDEALRFCKECATFINGGFRR